MIELMDVLISSPLSPKTMDWSSYYPAFVSNSEAARDLAHVQSEKNSFDLDKLVEDGPKTLSKNIEVADIGCGFGGLLVALAPMMPKTLLLGMLIWSGWVLSKSNGSYRNGNQESSSRICTRTHKVVTSQKQNFRTISEHCLHQSKFYEISTKFF